jgi:ribonuclease E
LKSGGYIVINPTEALVSIDVNSGKATKGRHIEETALKTNLEAAEEIARQLRLRDQGGLIVIDFIDMEDHRSNRIVEKKLRDAMQHDRARIQLGRISTFGLLELSRQRLHPSLVETNFEVCKHCAGSGLVRTVETTGVIVLRAIEEEGMRARAAEIKVSMPTEVALYIFNKKREMLADIEKRYNIHVTLHADDALLKPNYVIDIVRIVGAANTDQPAKRQMPVQSVDISDLPEVDETEVSGDDEASISNVSVEEETGGGHDNRPRRHHSRDDHPRNSEGKDGEKGNNRRRGRRGGRNRNRGKGRGDRPFGQQDGNQQQPQQQGGEAHPRQQHHHHDAPSQQRVLEHAGSPSGEGGGEGGDQRKGWWKRLTE